MQKYDAINKASVTAFEDALKHQRGSSRTSATQAPSNPADAFAAAMNESGVRASPQSQEEIDKQYEREYCRKGDWHKAWKTARSRVNPPTCRATWEADMREALLQDSLSQTSPL